MPDREYLLTMARYNMWQNESLLSAANGLPPNERTKDRGAFFGSIHNTLSHIFWGDMIWMHRFADTPAPDGSITDSTGFIRNWDQYLVDRPAFDRTILEWAHNVAVEWFEGELSWYSGAVGRELTRPKTTLTIQLFNHQTHHRGQVHAMLTAAGARPDDTDVPFMPDRFLAL